MRRERRGGRHYEETKLMGTINGLRIQVHRVAHRKEPAGYYLRDPLQIIITKTWFNLH